MEISPEQLAALVEVSKAYGVRLFARQRSKAAKSAMESARSELSSFGGYEDCGSFYQSQFDACEGVFNEAVSAEMSSERAFKRARLTAIEKYPSLGPLIENYVYVQQGKPAA